METGERARKCKIDASDKNYSAKKHSRKNDSSKSRKCVDHKTLIISWLVFCKNQCATLGVRAVYFASSIGISVSSHSYLHKHYWCSMWHNCDVQWQCHIYLNICMNACMCMFAHAFYTYFFPRVPFNSSLWRRCLMNEFIKICNIPAGCRISNTFCTHCVQLHWIIIIVINNSQAEFNLQQFFSPSPSPPNWYWQ